MENQKISCPECDKQLEWKIFKCKEFEEKYIECECGFTIAEAEYNEMINTDSEVVGDYHIPDYDENLSALNNL